MIQDGWSDGVSGCAGVDDETVLSVWREDGLVGRISLFLLEVGLQTMIFLKSSRPTLPL